jgi:hypothetical protein
MWCATQSFDSQNRWLLPFGMENFSDAKTSNRKRAIIALILLVPASSLGAWFGMVVFPHSLAGVVLFGASKVWLFALPVVWLKFVDREPLSLSPPRHGGFLTGILTGLVISALILATYWFFGSVLFDKKFLVERLTAIRLGSRVVFVGAALYWILVNSVLEEYVWRWFCVRQCEQLLSKRLAVVCSALFFTLHHIVAMSVYFGAAAVSVCALGVFVGGAIWSMMYIQYRSVWPGYVSHAIVDLCIFGIGASIMFGTR